MAITDLTVVLPLTEDLDEQELRTFMLYYDADSKSEAVAVLFCVFLGGLGAHQFYLRQIPLGILYLLFFWTLIPALVAFIELFFLGRRVRSYNLRLATNIRRRLY